MSGYLMVGGFRQIMRELRDDCRAHLVRYRLAQITERRRRRCDNQAMVGPGLKLFRENLSEMVGKLCLLVPVWIRLGLDGGAP